MKVRIDLAVEADLMEASDFYDMLEPGLGPEVEEFLIARLGELAVLAGIHPQCRGIFRQVVKGRFPYFVIYYEIVDGPEVLVRAIQDHRRDPAAITSKIEQRFQ